MAHPIENDTIVGTIVGTILSVIPNVESTDIVRTMILATVGAVASFIVSNLLKSIWQRLIHKGKKDKK